MAYNPLAFGLIIVATGAILFSTYLHRLYKKKINSREERTYGLIFSLIGLITLIFSFGIYFLEPIPAQYIEVYGVGYFIFSLLMITAGACLYWKLDTRPASYLAGISGIILLASARTILGFSLSKSPLATTGIFAFAGAGSLGTYLINRMTIKNTPKWIVYLTILGFLLCGLLALYSGINAQFGHVRSALASV